MTGLRPSLEKLDRVARFRQTVSAELTSPHRLGDLAIDGDDLLELGYTAGPALGEALATAPRARSSTYPSETRREALLGPSTGALASMIRWDAPGYVVAFTTREGGVSTGPFASLNLGSRDDDPARIAENRRIVCAELGLDAGKLAVNRQRHSSIVNRGRAGERGESGDGLWTDEPGVPLLALAADCVPIAIAAVDGSPALAVVHAGWRGLAGGVIGAAAESLGASPKRAIVGPADGAVLLRGRGRGVEPASTPT